MEVIVLSEHDSDNSIVEIEVPKKDSPPLVEIDEDDITLNVVESPSKIQRTDICKFPEFEEPTADVIPLNKGEFDQFKEPRPWCGRVDVSRLISPKHWTTDMMKFYNDDWGNEDYFTVENLQRQMDKRPCLWQMSQKDWEYMGPFKKSYLSCKNCGIAGHFTEDCWAPRRTVKCHMCGVEGHISKDCPNAICLSCGHKTRNYHVGCGKCKFRNGRICSRCSMRGHCLVECTDHWRLYHLTIAAGKVVVPSNACYRSQSELWCCNCGKKGHHQCFCPLEKNKDGYGLTVPFVMSYEREFYNQLLPREEIGQKLTNKELKKMRKASRLLSLNQLKSPENLAKPKKKLSQKDLENLKRKRAKLRKKKKKKERAAQRIAQFQNQGINS